MKLDYTPHFDTRFGVADFTGDGRLGLAGFGRVPTGAEGGAQSRLKPRDK